MVDEHTPWPTAKVSLSTRIIFDCGAVELVNSIGAARWIDWMREFDPAQQFVFRRCSRKIVDLINYIPEFRPQEGVVESFALPYECAQCRHEEIEWVERGRHFLEAQNGEGPQLLIPPQLNCSKCQGMMEFSVLEKIYLRFLYPRHAFKE
jgi:hypothetical protein